MRVLVASELNYVAGGDYVKEWYEAVGGAGGGAVGAWAGGLTGAEYGALFGGAVGAVAGFAIGAIGAELIEDYV
jgi:hypothetical protein